MNERESAFGRSAFSPSSPEARIAAIATAIANGDLGIIEGSRLLCCLFPRVTLTQDEPAFRTFFLIRGETIHLPVGDVRRLRPREELRERDVEIAVAEDRWREVAMAACMRLIERFGPTIFE